MLVSCMSLLSAPSSCAMPLAGSLSCSLLPLGLPLPVLPVSALTRSLVVLLLLSSPSSGSPIATSAGKRTQAAEGQQASGTVHRHPAVQPAAVAVNASVIFCRTALQL